MPFEVNYPFVTVILAAGKGKRMNNPDLPKVLFPLNGKPLVKYVIDQALSINSNRIVVIVGYLKEKVIEYLSGLNNPGIAVAIQDDQLGTGHAVVQTKPFLEGYSGNMLILSGDVPLISQNTLENFILHHYDNNADLSVLSAIFEDPSGYGRIIRDAEGSFTKIVEDKDASHEEKKVREINSGIYFGDAGLIFRHLDEISNHNAQGEYYLTDIIQILKNNGHKISAFSGANFDELQGINSQEQLAEMENKLNQC